ncbi:MAG: hypothetical protein ACLQIQ_13445, partial [Beijerinckiaceae bacterium]
MLLQDIFTVWQAPRPLRSVDVARRVAVLALPFGLVLVVGSAWFLRAAGLSVVWSCVGSYVVREMGASAPGWGLGLPEEPSWKSLPALAPFLVVYAIVPTTYLLVAGRRWGAGDGELGARRDTRDRLILLWLVGVALLLEVSSSLTWVRVFAVAWPGAILLVWLLSRGRRRRRLYVAIAWAAVAILAAVLIRSTRRHHSVVVDLPGGAVATDTAMRDELVWLDDHA